MTRKFDYRPLSCRLPLQDRFAIIRLAKARGMSISGLIKEALRPYLDGVDVKVDEQFVTEPVVTSLRPVIAAANRVRVDPPRSNGGFHERQK